MVLAKDILVSDLEGSIVDLGDGVKQVEQKDGYIENVEYWLEHNLPQPGVYIRIVIMSFPEDKLR